MLAIQVPVVISVKMTTITPVGPTIQNFEVPGIKVVISPNPNFQVPGVIKPQMSVVIKPKKSGVIANPLYLNKEFHNCLRSKVNDVDLSTRL